MASASFQFTDFELNVNYSEDERDQRKQAMEWLEDSRELANPVVPTSGSLSCNFGSLEWYQGRNGSSAGEALDH